MPISLEYLAGYFDGEGCICFLNKPDHKYAQLSMQIGAADRATLELFADFFGGVVKADPASSGKRLIWRWGRYTTKAQAALKQLLPYLIAKRPVAELALQVTYESKKGVPLSSEEVVTRARVAQAVREFNQRVDRPDQLSS